MGDVDEELIAYVVVSVAVKTINEILDKPWWKRTKHDRHWLAVNARVAADQAETLGRFFKERRNA
jgi:hypothetical protein